MTTLTHSPADVLRWCLIALGHGTDPDDGAAWPVYATSEPSSPDAVLTTYDTQGTDDGSSMIDGEAMAHEGVQVRIRSADHFTGWMKAHAIRDTLARSIYDRAVTIGTSVYLVHCAAAIGQVLSLGKESPTSSRNLFTVNCTLALHQVS